MKYKSATPMKFNSSTIAGPKIVFVFTILYKKNAAPKNRGDFNDCLPYEKLLYRTGFVQQATLPVNNYFFVVSLTILVESTTTLVESTFLVVSTGATTGVSFLVVSVPEAVEAPPPHDAKAVAKAKPKITFFIL